MHQFVRHGPDFKSGAVVAGFVELAGCRCIAHQQRVCATGNSGCTLITASFAARLGLVDASGWPRLAHVRTTRCAACNLAMSVWLKRLEWSWTDAVVPCPVQRARRCGRRHGEAPADATDLHHQGCAVPAAAPCFLDHSMGPWGFDAVPSLTCLLSSGKKMNVTVGVTKARLGCDLLISVREIRELISDGFKFDVR